MAIFDAWKRVGPRLKADPAELARRVDRRRRTLLGRPPRGWCLGVRASDGRIEKESPAILPWDGPGELLRHEVTLDAPLVRRLCGGVRIEWPGETLSDVAKKLGVSTRGLTVARLRGVLSVHYQRGLGGWWGKPVPMLYSERALDPSGQMFQRTDPLWSWAAEHLEAAVPEEFEQQLERVAVYRPTMGRGIAGEPRVYPSHKLPPPPGDGEDVCAWYKYKDGVYVGYDWRNPLSKKNYERHERRKALERASRGRLRRERGTRRESVSNGSLQFKGWQWVCPMCGKGVKIVYLPMPAIDVLARCAEIEAEWAGTVSMGAELGGIATVEQPPRRFACGACHRIRYVSAAEPSAWNHFVTYLSGGMLYGSEVDKPEAFAPRRKRAYRPQTSRPAPRRAHVLKRIGQGWTIKAIAKEMGVGAAAVHNHVKALRRQAEVSGPLPLTMG